jgi:lipid II:glycine glycyltransferase (peptidoglycan interpeptide bridge formation enzyme)
MAGAALVLYRQLPGVKRFLAYLPEGPVIDWAAEDLRAWLTPMVRHLAKAGAFGVRMGPPVVTRRWDAAAVKAGVADESVRRLGDVPPTERSQEGARVVSQLQELGWQPQAVEGGFAAGQPQYNFVVPLQRDGVPRTEDDLLAGMNQQWRRNIKKAAKAGVEVTRGKVEGAGSDDLAAFHDLYVLTAGRDHFTPRPLSYFETMFGALQAESPDRIRLYLAHHEGDLVAATVMVHVGGHAWYSYGASSTEKRDVRGSNAVQWAMLRDALAAGAEVYDLRGITDTLDPDDPHVGLIQFKVGTGGQAVEYAGEWDMPVNPLLYKAFSVYMQRRSGAGR